MRFDYSVAEKFFAYLQGEVALEEALSNHAYQAVFSHSSRLGIEITFEDVELAVLGKPSAFYGLKNINHKLPTLQRLLAFIRDKEQQWLEKIEGAIEWLLPAEDHKNVVIYPIVGYDAGIGHKDAVCLNLNMEYYLENPFEFLYLTIHESFHALYEHIHPCPSLTQVKSAEDRLSVFNTFMQNEGYAIYAPLNLRFEKNHLKSCSELSKNYPVLEEYPILHDKREIIKHVKMFDTLSLNLKEIDYMTIEDYCKEAFGPQRLSYRVGLLLVRLIEKELGIDEVRQAVYLKGDEFVKKYNYLLSIYR